MDNNTTVVGSWLNQAVNAFADVSSAIVYFGVGTGVVIYNAVDQYIVPFVRDTTVSVTREGEQFCKAQIYPVLDNVYQRGELIVSEWTKIPSAKRVC